MTLHQKILSIYPELADFDFSIGIIKLQNDGDGDYISAWNHPTLTKPTDEQLKGIN